MKRILFLLLFSVIIKINFSQETSYPFLLEEQIHFLIGNYIEDSCVSLCHLRKTTDLLTNRDITHVNGVPLAKRRKAFIRHVKHLSEKLEEIALDKTMVNDSTLNLISELEYLKSSIIAKSNNNLTPFPTIKEKKEMAINSLKSKKWMRYPILPISNINPNETAYWKPINEDKHRSFNALSKLKGINSGKEMAVIFKKLNYSGSAPKIRTYDLNLDDEWSLKWGDEVHTDVAASRIFAAIGYDIDHPYCYKNGKLMLIFDGSRSINNWEQLRDSISAIYDTDLEPFFLEEGTVNQKMATENNELSGYVGNNYVKFIKCGLEARPDRVKRLGTFLPDQLYNHKRLELRGALLLHAFIGNWDTRKENTLLTTVHDGNYNYDVSAVFSDLGASFGVSYSILFADFKVGLVNEFPWEVAFKKKNKVFLKNPINEFPISYSSVDYNDLRWMAKQISHLDSLTLRKCVSKAKWPYPIEELFFNKLASRRASIISSFDIIDPNPIEYNRKITIEENGEIIVKKGELIVDYKIEENPESFISKKGRKRNYGY
jgi:hypothetical protein|tara:strand:- start:118 stop:1749 length:1632 start_codon:yes stop_codon:yes gene_type:complete